jgi:hypothetical protein
MIRVVLIALSAMLLVACGETDQTKSAANTNRADVPPWQGANNPYVAQGWSAGNQTSWETQLRTRSQYQNEYARVN